MFIHEFSEFNRDVRLNQFYLMTLMRVSYESSFTLDRVVKAYRKSDPWRLDPSQFLGVAYTESSNSSSKVASMAPQELLMECCGAAKRSVLKLLQTALKNCLWILPMDLN